MPAQETIEFLHPPLIPLWKGSEESTVSASIRAIVYPRLAVVACFARSGC